MSEMLLFGAGASVEAGVPASVDMAKKIVEKFNDQDWQHRENKSRHIINFVVGGLLFKAGESNRNPLLAGVDVEDLFNAVLLLADRNSLEMSPFVGSWHSMVEAFDRIDPPPPDVNNLIGSIQDQIDNQSSRSSWGRRINSGLERQLKTALQFQQQKPANGINFRRLANEMIFLLSEFVWIESAEKVAYLQPVISRCKKVGRMVIATLNYDNAVELASEQQSVMCNIGIDVSNGSKSCSFGDEGLQLIKLHGSIDWQWTEGLKDREMPMPNTELSRVSIETVRVSRRHGHLEQKPAVVFGQRNKLTSDGPFLELLRTFQIELANSQSLIVVGYSFRDSHINTYIADWINQSPDNKITIIDPSFKAVSYRFGDGDFRWHLQNVSNSQPERVKILKRPLQKLFWKYFLIFSLIGALTRQMRHTFLVSQIKECLTFATFCVRVFVTLVFIGCDVVSLMITGVLSEMKLHEITQKLNGVRKSQYGLRQ